MYRLFSWKIWIGWVFFAVGLSLIGCNCDDPTLGGAGKFASDQTGDQVIFGDLTIGKAQSKEILVYNSGGLPFSVENISVLNDKNKVFSISKKPDTPFTLEPGRSKGVKITVQFLPKQAGTFTAQLSFRSPDADNVDNEGLWNMPLSHQNLSADPQWSCGDKKENSLNFGAVERGKSVTKSCMLSNRGNAPLRLEKILKYDPIKGSDSDFKWKGPKFPIIVEPDGKPVKIEVTYSPSDYPPREDEGYFIFSDGNKDTKEDNLPRLKLLGLTAVPVIEIIPLYPPCKVEGGKDSCQRIDKGLTCQEKLCRQAANATPKIKFPLTSKGKTTTRIMLIRNIGDRPLTVTEIKLDDSTSNDFSVVTQGLTLPFTLAPKEEKQVSVEYTPSDEKEDKGKAIISSDAGNNPKAPVLIEAASRGCNIEVNPRKLDFRGPTGKTITITNVGNESCVINKVSLKSGKTEPFSMLSVPEPDLTLVPNGSHSFLVRFKPKGKEKANDFAIIESSDPDEPTIEVEIVGEVTGDRECQIKTTPATLNYGLVPVGRSRKMSVTIENEGWGECNVDSLAVNGTNPAGNTAFVMNTNFRPTKIIAGNNIRIDISYTPPAERSGYEGVLVINSDDGKQPQFETKLVGSSGTLCLEVVPPNMDFGSTKFGCSTPKRLIEVFNLGSSKCASKIDVTGISLAKGTTKEFRIMSAPTTPRSLNPGESIRIEMSYKANDLGVDTGTLELFNSVAGQSPIPIPLVGEGVSTSDQKDVFKQLKRPLTDIMFVIDDSCSMGEEQASLASNFTSFIQWAVRLNVDYQIMATTTDIQKSGANAPGCSRGAVKIVTPQTPNPQQSFAANVKVGTSGSGSEKGLEAAYRGLIPPASTGCNQGFYRKDASLSLIFVSDEPDQSPQTVQFYISFMKSLKGLRNLDLIRASSVVGPPPSGCRNPGTGSAASAPRYWEVAKQLKGVTESICNSNWSATLSNIGSITFGYRTQFFLSRQADPKTLKVKVNGKEINEDPNDGWTYDASNNSVNFTKSQIPAPGATIEISYKAICLP